MELKKLLEDMDKKIMKALEEKTTMTISTRIATDKMIKELKENQEEELKKIEEEFNKLKEAHKKQKEYIINNYNWSEEEIRSATKERG